MRLFIAIQFPDQIRTALAETMTDLRRQGVSGNFSRVENLHLTLAFLGEVKSPPGYGSGDRRAVPADIGQSGSFGDLYWVGLERESGAYGLRKKTQEKAAGGRDLV